MLSTQKNIFSSHSKSDTQKLAKKIAREFSRGSAHGVKTRKKTQAIVVALSGNLGSGKTTFTKAFLKALGVHATVASPTFVLSREYDLKKGFYKKAYHLDVYRLNQKETSVLELKKIFKEPNSIVLIEWAEKIKHQLPKGALWIHFNHGSKANERQIKIL